MNLHGKQYSNFLKRSNFICFKPALHIQCKVINNKSQEQISLVIVRYIKYDNYHKTKGRRSLMIKTDTPIWIQEKVLDEILKQTQEKYLNEES